jgi:hypothetical protein
MPLGLATGALALTSVPVAPSELPDLMGALALINVPDPVDPPVEVGLATGALALTSVPVAPSELPDLMGALALINVPDPVVPDPTGVVGFTIGPVPFRVLLPRSLTADAAACDAGAEVPAWGDVVTSQ